MITKISQSTLAPPWMSWRRKTSAMIRKSNMNQAIQTKKMSIVQTTSKNG